jgi:hemoglobin/transferrin/lactoferrin receptor protein
VGDGYVYGIELGAAYRFLPSWTVFGLATFMEGKVETFPTSAPVVEEESIDRLMPFTAELGFRWQSQERDLHAELLGIWADDADRLSTRDEGDTQRIPPGGTPGYFVLHANAGWQISRHATFDVAVDNLTNEDYRVHGSGSNMPGTNLILGLTVRL